MGYSDKIFEYLQGHKIRITKHIEVVVNVIIEHSTPVDAKTIYLVLTRSHYDIDLSTIHRILFRLQKLGLIDALYGEKSTYYELSSQFIPHHHHFNCIQCGKIIDIDGCMMNLALNSLDSIGTPISHSFEIKGICKSCK